MADTRPVIAHVLHRLTLAGAEVLAAGLARQLRERYRFVFVCLDEAGPMAPRLEQDGFPVIGLSRRPGIDWRLGRTLRNILREQRVDIVHAHQYTPFFYTALGRRRGRPRILFTEHGRHYPDLRSTRRVLANRVLLRPSDRVTAVGGFVRNALADNEGIARRRIEVIYNGIDPETFAPPPDGGLGRRQAREAMGVPEHVPVLLQVARFHPVKDHATAIRGFARAHDTFPDARLVLVGEGETMAEMQQIAWDAGVADHTHFLGVRDDVHALLPGADLFVLSSLSEGISVTLLEAMAARLPIVATHVGGNPEVVEHGQTGLLSPRGDPLGMAHNMQLLLGDPPTRRRMGDAGHERLLQQFTQQQMHDQYAQLYDAMTGKTLR